MVVKLQELEFPEDEALVAVEQCEDIYTAVKFLRQECELCANNMNVKEVRLCFTRSRLDSTIASHHGVLKGYG